jgi:nitrogen fixation/metabolism regulation signal transduction histidine kinase
MVTQFVLAVIVCVGLSTVGLVTYYGLSPTSARATAGEFVVVYRQIEHREPVVVEGRQIERRSYTSEALPQTTRWALVVPPLLVNNLVIVIVLCVLAIRFSSHYAGPVYRMSTDIRRVLAGETGVRVQLRRGDEIKELANRLNALLDVLEHAEARLRSD